MPERQPDGYKDIIILGAGITGLISAWKLAKAGKNVTIIERSSEPGGLSRTTNWDGFRFDRGAHNLFSRNQKILDFLIKELSGDLIERERNFALMFFRKIIPFPFLGSDIIQAFSPLFMSKVLFTFFTARITFFFSKAPDSIHLDEWIIRRFGRPLYDTYFRPYLERVQCCDPHELSSIIGHKKIPAISLRRMIRQLIKKVLTKTSLQVQSGKSYYPIQGYGSIPRHFYTELAKMPNVTFRFNEAFKKIELENNLVVKLHTDKEAFTTTGTSIISTIPLELLFNQEDALQKEIAHLAARLKCASMRFMMVKVKKPNISGYWILSINDAHMPFYRVSEESAGTFQMAPEGHSSLLFELPINPGDALAEQPDAVLVQSIIDEFGKMFPITMDDVIDYKSVTENHCNPRMIVDYQNILKEVFGYIASVPNLFSIGRQGLFTYANLDHCVQMGLDFSEAYLNNRAKDGNQELLKQYFNSGF